MKHRLALAAGAVLVALGAGLAVWFVGHGGEARPAEDPIAFMRTVIRQVAANDYDRLWLKLHPAQQRVATREAYVECEQASPIPGHLDWIRLVSSRSERIKVAGDTGTVVSQAARFEVRLSEPVLKDHVIVPMTVHAVPVEGRWRWILSPLRFEKYRTNTCLGTGGPPVP